MKELGFGILVLVALVGFILGATELGFEINAHFWPKYAQLQQTVFENTKTYNDGMVRDLENLKQEYDRASADQRAMLRDTIIHRFSVYKDQRLPDHLHNFYIQLRDGGAL